ncbi:MAG: crossover junction endodeoxyribonuclease RuvC [Candidatus Omnitrophota bacterium]
MKIEERIIAVDPGTRYQGIAVFQDETLNVSLVKNLRDKGSRRERLKEIEELFQSFIEGYAPDVLVIKRFLPGQPRFLKAVIDEIKHLARKEKMRICNFSPLAVRKIIGGNVHATRKDMAEKVSSIYPKLKNRPKENLKFDWPELKNHPNQDRKSFQSNLKIKQDEDKQKNENRKRKLREKYWGYMFDAVGLGVCYLSKLIKSNSAGHKGKRAF